MIDLGDPLPDLAINITDDDGKPADAGAVTLTITLPDGTEETPTVSNPEVGRYEATYVTVQAGLHRTRWVATGANTSAYADAYNVVDGTWPAFVGLREVKHHLNYEPTDTTHDEELRGFILSASAVVEDIVGVVARRQIVETHSGGQSHLILLKAPVQSVSQIEADGTVVDATRYTTSSSGLVERKSGRWPDGFHNIEVTYWAGRGVVTPNIINATNELIRVNWRPQQGGNYSAFDGGGEDDFGVPRNVELSLQGELRLGFFVPNTVMQRLNPDRRGPVVM